MEDSCKHAMKQQIKDMKQMADIWLVHRAISTEQHHEINKILTNIEDSMPEK